MRRRSLWTMKCLMVCSPEEYQILLSSLRPPLQRLFWIFRPQLQAAHRAVKYFGRQHSRAAQTHSVRIYLSTILFMIPFRECIIQNLEKLTIAPSVQMQTCKDAKFEEYLNWWLSDAPEDAFKCLNDGSLQKDMASPDHRLHRKSFLFVIHHKWKTTFHRFE